MVKTGFSEFNIYGPLLNICWHLKHRSKEHLLTGKAKYGVPPRTSKDVYYKTLRTRNLRENDRFQVSRCLFNGTARFFAFSIIKEGTTEKALQFIMPLKSLYKQNLGLIEQKMYF